MITFADYLEKYMNNNQLSRNYLSNHINISRRTLGRYLSGESIPKTLDKVMEIANATQITEEEQSALIEIWKNDKKNRVYSAESNLLDKIFQYKLDCNENLQNSYEQENIICDNISFKHDNCTKLLTGDKIIECFKYVLNTSGKIKIRVNNGIEVIDNLIIKAASARSNLTIEQIIVIEKNRNRNANKLISEYEKMIPICMGRAKYKAYCCYCEKLIERSINRELYIVSDNGLLVFDGNLTRGLFSNQVECCKYFNVEFDILAKKCNTLCEGYDTSLFGKYKNAVCCDDSDYADTKIYYLQNDSHLKICVHKSQRRTRVLFIEEPQIVYGLQKAMKLRL